MPEHLEKRLEQLSAAPAKTTLNGGANINGGSTFSQRREEICKRLQQSAEQCVLNYNGRKELATERDECVAELCEALTDAFSYGLRQQDTTFVMSPASIFQNMHEIVTGNTNGSNGDTTFWDFCQIHLTAHERERYENLQHIWTKHGRGKAFIRAALNENSLQRYVLTWLSCTTELRRYYTPWSLLLDVEIAQKLPHILGNLDNVLFALNVDAVELNVASRSVAIQPVAREEPIIYAPTPVPVVSSRTKRKTNIVERPIVTTNSTEDLLKLLRDTVSLEEPKRHQDLMGSVETVTCDIEQVKKDAEAIMRVVRETPPDAIEPELEFLKQPFADFYAASEVDELQSVDEKTPSITAAGEQEFEDDKSDTSSQYSKSSSANCTSANQTALEEKLREMSERCVLLETRVAQLSLENRQLVRRLTQHFKESGIDPSSSLATNFLITIPHVKLNKSKGGSSYYTYEIHITMRQHLDHWILLRRYREFYKLHKSLLRTHPSIAAVEFPPKKHFGNMNLVFVEERRQQLQIYLLNVVEMLPHVEACKTKAELQKVFPFLRER